MDNPNPIYYRDLITPDNSIQDLIKQLQELIGQYDTMKAKIKDAAADMTKGMQNVTSATDEQREQIKSSYEESERLSKSYTKVANAEREAERVTLTLKKAQKEKTDIDKLMIQLAVSQEGSYNKLSAQYRLNKIRLNEMSEAERKGTEAGRKLEAETKAIYERMNDLQLATGKAQLQVGHYERGLLSAVGVSGRFSDAILDSGKAMESIKGTLGAMKSPLGAIAGAIGTAVAAFKLWKETVNETQTSSDNLAFAVAQLHGVWSRFAKAVAEIDFSGFIRGAVESAKAAKNLAVVLDEVFERTNSIELQRSAMSAENAALEEMAKNTALSYEERRQAAEKYINNVKGLYEQEIAVSKDVRDAELESLFALTNKRQFASEQERDAAKEEFAERIKTYNLNREVIAQASEYIDTENKRSFAISQSAKAGGVVYAKLIEQYDGMLAKADEATLQTVEFLKQYNLSNDTQVQAYIDAQKAYDESQAALFNENKRFIVLMNNLEAQSTKAAEKGSNERVQIVKKEVEAKQALESEGMTAVAQSALLQAELQSINLQISITKEGTEEMLALRLESINKQREIEIEANRNKVEALRQDEKAINAKYDAQILKTEADFYTQLAERDFAAQQDLDAAEFSLLQTTEQEKTRFRLQQEKERLQKILELNETSGEKLSEIEIASIKATIAGIDKEYSKAGRGQQDVYDLLGLKWDDDQKAAMDSVVSQTLENVGEIIDAWKEAAQARVDAAQESVDAAQDELDAEIEARDNGYANNVAEAQRNLELQKAQLAEAEKENEKATKAQLALDTITQTASLITASANIWKSLSEVPVVGPALAVAALATMWGSFAVAKVKAAQVASTGTESYGEGTVELLEGGSHASGHDIDMGRTKEGKNRRAEGGEFFAIINKRNSRRYRSVIPEVINSLNDGTFADKFQRANEAMSGIAVGLLGGGTDVSRLENDVRAIRRQGDESRYVDGSGRTVVRYKNLTRIVRG